MDKIKFGPYGEFNLQIGGELRTLRFKATALEYLEEELGKSVFSIISNQDSLGMKFCRVALTAGVMHEFIGKKGKRKGILTEDLVRKWIEECDEKDGLEFGDLLGALVEGIVRGMPGGSKMLEEVTDDNDDEAQAEKNDE